MPELVREWSGDAGGLRLVVIHPQPRQINLRRFFWREFTLAGARLYVRTDFGKAVSQLDDSTIPAERLISKVMPLAEASAAFEALEGGGDVMKILVDCTVDVQGVAA